MHRVIEYHPGNLLRPILFFVVDFLLGKAKLRRLDQDANQYLTNYVHHFKGNSFH